MSKQDGWYRSWFKISPRPKPPENHLVMYLLCEPITHEVRYVGATKRWPFERFMEHLAATRPGSRKMTTSDWIAGLYERGLMPELQIIEIVPEAEWAAKEQRYITAHADTALNVSDGGPGFSGTMNPQHRAAIARGNTGVSRGKGQHKSASHRAAISAAQAASWERRRANQT